MIKMEPKKAVKSKGMIAGVFLILLGAYIIVDQKDITGGMTVIGLGLGIMGIRDARED